MTGSEPAEPAAATPAGDDSDWVEDWVNGDGVVGFTDGRPVAEDDEFRKPTLPARQRPDDTPETSAGQVYTSEHAAREPEEKRGDVAEEKPWSRYPNEHWIVGDEGRQPTIRTKIAGAFKAPPPDTIIDGAEIGTIVYRAASVRGFSHQEHGLPRQDNYAIRFTKDQKWMVGCIADGVSEGLRSHEAAAAISEQLTDTLVAHLIAYPPGSSPGAWNEAVHGLPWQQAIRAANDEVLRIAKDHLTRVYEGKGDTRRRSELDSALFSYDSARKFMSATACVFAIATEQSSNGKYRAMLANIAGDSTAFTVADRAWRPLTKIKNEDAEVFSSSVKSLPNDVPAEPIAFELEVGQMFIVMTDGLGDPLGAGNGPVGDFLALKWHTPPDILAFATHLAFYRRTFTDDRTAIAVWPGPKQQAR